MTSEFRIYTRRALPPSDKVQRLTSLEVANIADCDTRIEAMRENIQFLGKIASKTCMAGNNKSRGSSLTVSFGTGGVSPNWTSLFSQLGRHHVAQPGKVRGKSTSRLSAAVSG